MSKKLNVLLSTLLVFSLVTPTAFAETDNAENSVPSADSVILSTDAESTSEVTPFDDKASNGTTPTVVEESVKDEPVKDDSTKDEPVAPDEEVTKPEVTTTVVDETPKEEEEADKEATEDAVKEDAEDVKVTAEEDAPDLPQASLEGLPTTSTGISPKEINDLGQKFYDEMDAKVDKTTTPYKDGIYLELRYVNPGHIPSFKLALVDENGKGLGSVQASRANYDPELKAYKLVIPHSKALNKGDKIGIYAYDFDGSVKSITLKREIPLQMTGEGDKETLQMVEEKVPLKNENYYFYQMGTFLIEHDDVIEKHHTFSAFNPLEGWIETNENLVAFTFKTEQGTPVKNTSFTLQEPRNGNKVTLKTNAHGVAYVAKNKFKAKLVSLVSAQYELAQGFDTIGVDFNPGGDRTAVKTVIVQAKKSESKEEGVANISVKVNGDTTFTNEWIDSTVTFTSGTNVYNFSIGHNDIAKGLQVNLPNGTYKVTSTAPNGKVTLSHDSLTVKGNNVNLTATIAPKFVLEISKDGKPYSFKVLNVTPLTDKVIKGTSTLSYGVVPNQSFMVEDQADGKVYTVFINPDYTVTKLVLGVGVVWGGEVSTPHTGDNIIFLVALFLLSLIIAGVGFYFHRTGRRIKHVAVTSGLIGVLILSTIPLNFVQAETFIVNIDGSAGGVGSSGKYTLMSRGTLQVHSDASMVMTTFVPMQSEFELTYRYDSGQDFKNYGMDDYMLSEYHLPTALFFPTNKSQYQRAFTGSFMVYNYEEGGLEPIWGTKNAVLGDIPENYLKMNRDYYGILNKKFSDRLMSYPEKGMQNGGNNYYNDIDVLINHMTVALGGGGDTRQLWTGKDIAGKNSSSTKQIGDVINKDLSANHIKNRYKKYFPYYDLKNGLPVDTIIEMYMGALKGKTDPSILTDLKENTAGSFENSDLNDDIIQADGSSNKGYISVASTKAANYMIMFQNIHGVYINGYSQTNMAYMPIVDIGEWYNDAMRKARSDYRALNLTHFETAKMLYDAKAYKARGTNNPLYYTTAPTKTFVGNVAATTGKSLMPTTLKIKPRTSNSAAQLNQNPYAGWGYMYMSSFFVGYGCASCVQDELPGINSWLKLHITNEDGSEETKRVPWNKIVDEKGQSTNFLSLSGGFDESKIRYDFDGSYVHDGVLYTINDNPGNKDAKVTLIDTSALSSMYKPYKGVLSTSGKHDALYDGYYFLHKDEKPVGGPTVDVTNLPVTLDNNYLPMLSSVKAALSADPEIQTAIAAEIAKATNDAIYSSVVVQPLKGSGYQYPTEKYDSQVGYLKGKHYSQADLTLEIYVDASCIDLKKCGNLTTPINPSDASGVHTVPEWRLSKYFNDSTPTEQSNSLVNFTTPGSTWNSPSVTHGGNTKFNLSASDLSGVPWMESKPKMFNGDTENRSVSAYGNRFTFQVGGDLLAIKDNSTVTNSKLASWKNDYSILNKKIGAAVQGSVEPNGKKSVTKTQTVKYLVRSPYSNYTYSEDRTSCDKYSCWLYRWSGAANMSYPFDSTNHISVVFKRYNPQASTKVSSFAKKVDKSANGFYWESYQDTQTLKVNPEVPMVYDDNSGNVTVVQSAGDRIREIKPVHYNSVQFHNVNITPKVDGMSVATDAQAKVLANSKGKGLDVIYKGASTSASYEVTGEIKLRTYALDVGSKALKNTWGNSTYSTEKVRDEFLTRHATKEADGTWTIKPTAKGNYVIANKDYGGVSEIKNVKQKDYQVIEHTLVVRGGKVLSVDGQTDLTKLDPLLKDAVDRMNISTARGSNVFNQFEYGKGANLTESNVANLLNTTRGVNEHSVGKPWYYEDTSTLVVREYITTYDLPSHVYVDKIPQEIPGLQTPMTKDQFFKKGETGFGKYRIQLLDSWMEYDSSKPTPFGGVQTRLYVVPNVSITDTVQF